MSTTPEQEEEIRQVFRKNVPEIAEGTVEIAALARNAGRRTCVAVVSHNPAVSAIDACSGRRGARLKAISSELCGEKLGVIRWHPSPEQLIANALSSTSERMVLDTEAHQAMVMIDRPGRRLAGGKADPTIAALQEHIGLVAEMTGWKISLAEI